DFRPNAGGTYNLLVSHRLAADNGNDGISVDPTGAGAAVRVAINHVRSVNNSSHGVSISGGIAAGTGTITATVTDSVSANNGGIGFLSFSVAGQPTVSLTVIRSVAANNRGAGVEADTAATATLRVGETTIAGNAKAWSAAGGATLQSFGDNHVAGNADGDPALPVIARK